MKFIIDENLPDNISLWNNSSFIHVLKIAEVTSDSDIWKYALENNYIILTKDTDFYFRFLSALSHQKSFGLTLVIDAKKSCICLLRMFGKKLNLF